MRHRLDLNFEAEAEGITTDHIIAQVLKLCPLPPETFQSRAEPSTAPEKAQDCKKALNRR